jgi:3-methyladenine DNA glycosylase AlkC
MSTEKRKGAKSTKDIPNGILTQLNQGVIETANLIEWLAVDQCKLLNHILNDLGKPQYIKPILSHVDALKKKTVTTINEAIGVGLLTQVQTHKDKAILKAISTHVSDSVRCWATYTIGRDSSLSLANMLAGIHPFAADHHFGVREIAWIAIRPRIAQELTTSITLLQPWTSHPDAHVRRLAIEVTRPRGVWCEHIDILKQQPEIAQPLLDALYSDPARYVQDSVANWLNDASKTQPQYVRNLCAKWQKSKPSPATQYIIKRALRTLDK